jgi:uncharacterized protein with FMN-binding domain
MYRYVGAITIVGIFAILYVVQQSFEPAIAEQEKFEDVEVSKEVMALSAEDYEAKAYADGTYSQKLVYEAPYGHREPMEVQMTLEYGIITDVNVSFEESNLTSEEYQDWFQEYYKNEVVGQVIEAVSLSRIGGASLTNNAFDASLERIKEEASGEIVTNKDDLFVPLDMPSTTVDLDNLNGTYIVEDEYYVMAGLSEPMRTSVTLENGVITDADFAFKTRDIHSEYHQRDFVAVYKDEVLGKQITDVPFSRIGGASLTTQGFNDALQDVINKASENSI